MRVMTENRRFSEQAVVMLSPRTDDRVRSLAVRHCVSYGKAMRVIVRIGLTMAERLGSDAFEAEHLAETLSAERRHADCEGSWHTLD